MQLVQVILQCEIMKKDIIYKAHKSNVYILLPIVIPNGNKTQKDADKRVRKLSHFIRN